MQFVMKFSIVLLLNFVLFLNGELYSAIEDLKKLALNEEQLIEHWEWLELEMEINLDYLRK